MTRTALVTGGSNGIGAAITQALLSTDHRLAIIDVREPAEEAFSGEWAYFECAVEKTDQVDAVVKQVISKFGQIDILVNNAGINRDSTIWNMDETAWDQVLDVDLKGCFNFCRAAAPHFREQRSGKIVNISSINGLRGKFGQTNYAAAKAGIIGFSKSLARELGRRNINVNVVTPGFIETDMTKVLPDDIRQAAVNETCLNRLGTPADIANLVSFLCSDAARHITGQVISVDGGQYL